MLPANIAQLAEDFGRYEYDQAASGVDGTSVWADFVAPLYPLAQAEPTAFLQQLADAALPVGGWSVYGASHLDWEFFSGANPNDPSHRALLTASLTFLRESGVPLSRLTGYEGSFWREHLAGGQVWLEGRPTPTPGAAPLTPLHPGEVRRIAVLEARPNSQEVHIWRESSDSYAAVLKPAWRDEDPRQIDGRLQVAQSQYLLYVGVGLALQVETYWADRELRPFFPLPWPRIGWLPQASTPPT